MGPLNIALWVVGLLLLAAGYARGRRPWARYQELKARDANIARYEAWRGGIRDNEPTGASVAMAMLRRQVQVAAAIAVAGVMVFLAGFAVH